MSDTFSPKKPNTITARRLFTCRRPANTIAVFIIRHSDGPQIPEIDGNGLLLRKCTNFTLAAYLSSCTGDPADLGRNLKTTQKKKKKKDLQKEAQTLLPKDANDRTDEQTLSAARRGDGRATAT